MASRCLEIHAWIFGSQLCHWGLQQCRPPTKSSFLVSKSFGHFSKNWRNRPQQTSDCKWRENCIPTHPAQRLNSRLPGLFTAALIQNRYICTMHPQRTLNNMMSAFKPDWFYRCSRDLSILRPIFYHLIAAARLIENHRQFASRMTHLLGYNLHPKTLHKTTVRKSYATFSKNHEAVFQTRIKLESNTLAIEWLW